MNAVALSIAPGGQVCDACLEYQTVNR